MILQLYIDSGNKPMS